MKTVKVLLIFVAATFLIFLAACANQNSNAASSGNSATSVSNDCAGVPTPSVDVNALIQEKLQNHHDVERIYSAQHTREEWNATLDRMIGYGANISETEKQQIIDYLVCFHP